MFQYYYAPTATRLTKEKATLASSQTEGRPGNQLDLVPVIFLLSLRLHHSLGEGTQEKAANIDEIGKV